MEITTRNIYNQVNLPFTEEYMRKVVIDFIAMTTECDKYIPMYPENFEPYKAFYSFLKTNNTKGISVSNEIDDLNKRILNTSIENGTYNPVINNGQEVYPITGNQLGWYTYQSWHLSNDKRYHSGEISHRFYINANSSDVPKFIVLLKEKFEERNMTYYFKVSNGTVMGNIQKDGIVIYSSTENLDKNLEVLGEIEKEFPEFIKNCGEPHRFCGNINGWLGYANETKGKKNSYTGLMSKVMFESFETCVLNWINKNPDITIGSEKIKLSQYFNGSILTSETMECFVRYIKRLGYLISIIPKYDNTFKSELYEIIKDNLTKQDIDINNICFNFDVLGEINNYNYLQEQNQSTINVDNVIK